MTKATHPTTDRDLHDWGAFKALLGDFAEQYTDAQLRRIQQDMFLLAEILLDFYLLTRRSRNQRVPAPPGSSLTSRALITRE